MCLDHCPMMMMMIWNSLQCWEYGLPLCEELAVVYKERIKYDKLSRILVGSPFNRAPNCPSLSLLLLLLLSLYCSNIVDVFTCLHRACWLVASKPNRSSTRRSSTPIVSSLPTSGWHSSGEDSPCFWGWVCLFVCLFVCFAANHPMFVCNYYSLIIFPRLINSSALDVTHVICVLQRNLHDYWVLTVQVSSEGSVAANDG